MSLGIGKIFTPLGNTVAKGINKLAHTGTANKIAQWGAQPSSKVDLLGKTLNNFDARVVPTMAALLPIWISSFYVISNLKSDKIPKERKIPLLINDIIICTFSTVAGFTVAKLFDAMQTGMMQNLDKVVKNVDKAKMLKGGIKQMMAIAAFTLVFRYLGPVIATPLADKANSFLIKHNLIDDPKKKAKDKGGEDKKVALQYRQAGNKLDVSSADYNQKYSAGFEAFLKQVKFNPNKSFTA